MKTSHPWLSRRRLLARGLAVATALKLERTARAAEPPKAVCALAPEQEQGPFYLERSLLRSDITEGKPGVALALRLTLLDARTCQPLANAAIDLWHCDAMGLYSGYTNMGELPSGVPGAAPGRGPPDGPPADGPRDPRAGDRPPRPPDGARRPPQMRATDALTFLRGVQLTGPDGAATFQTIFPGFYPGRVNHIHFKARIGGTASGHHYRAGHTSHVGQLFFPEALAVSLMQREPYRRHQIHRTTASEDHVFQEQQGELFVAQMQPLDDRAPEAGLRAELTVAVDPEATPSPIGFGPVPAPRPPSR